MSLALSSAGRTGVFASSAAWGLCLSSRVTYTINPIPSNLNCTIPNQVFGSISRMIFELVKSDDVASKLGGVAAMDALIEVTA